MNKYLNIISYSLILLTGIGSEKLEAKDHQNPPNYQQAIPEDAPANNQLTQAKEFYERGEYEQAIALLKTTINQAEKRGDILEQTQGLVNLSLIYLKQSNWQETETNLNKIFQLINKINSQVARDKLTNYALEIKGELELGVGQPEQALATWEKSGEIAYHRGDIQSFIHAQIKQIQALQELGMYGKAGKILENIEPQLETVSQDLFTGQAWLSLGNISSKLGQLELAKEALKRALNIAQEHQNSDLISSILLAQGHLYFSQNRVLIETTQKDLAELNLLQTRKVKKSLQETINYYQKAAAITNNPSFQINAYLSEFDLLASYNRQNISDHFIRNLTSKINKLPKSKSLINQRINFALNLIGLNQNNYNSLILQQLTQAYQESEILNYQRGKSEALGSLAKLYQQSQRLKEARELTEKALYIAETIQFPDLAYQWQWQLGKISSQQNKRKESISAYSSAVNTLKSLRSELVGVNADLEFNFRENVEPVYRELVDILLQAEATDSEIKLARDVIESLQIAELDNYFRDACLDVKEVDLDRVADVETAVFYPIILANRLEVIVSLPGNEIRRYGTPIKQNKLEDEIQTLINGLYDIQEIQVVNQSLNGLYNYLIRPIAQELPALGIKNLVFVADGFLKSVPMAALYDGNQYLVENYNIALAPSLKLVEPETIRKKEIQVLLAGLSQINAENPRAEQYDDLPYVEQELNTLTGLIPQTSTLFNQTFTQNQFEEKVGSSPWPVVHIATHGEFSSQLEDTYLLTWDDEIKIDELNSLFRQYTKQKEPVELLVLSACKTAVGDKRAALGLAGVAVKAGARSTIASLWYVSDESTALLMGKFYRELVNNSASSKAEALRLAQLELIDNSDFQHPYFWSAFILIGNWL
jgi:CHAT domain-containing protein